MKGIDTQALGHLLLPQLAQLADRAGRAILAVYAQDFAVQTKADASPVTAADLAAHRVIVGGLARMTPGIPVLSEESANVPWPTRRAWPVYWLVDPLDGTREFIKRNGEFTVNIALIVQGRPKFAVVSAPAKRECFLARVSRSPARRGAWQHTGGRWVPLRTRPVGACPVVMASRSHRSAAVNTLFAHEARADLQGVGSSLKFCRIAQGVADIYPKLGPTSEWDTAAGQAVLEAAGGAVLQWDGTPLRYNSKPSLLNPHFLAVGRVDDDWPQRLA